MAFVPVVVMLCALGNCVIIFCRAEPEPRRARCGVHKEAANLIQTELKRTTEASRGGVEVNGRAAVTELVKAVLGGIDALLVLVAARGLSHWYRGSDEGELGSMAPPDAAAAGQDSMPPSGNVLLGREMGGVRLAAEASECKNLLISYDFY
mmetsp:Transcript_88330/g.175610  ORF Transcript_88330/g.175610 Transcript_88330/m.175610 type:complete len:151 (-) Transcript_88330:136-588(-)|eukprot:CAMPEP_0172674528 /NCGR_PEP_ID=MMETSP1074-20121228/12783_1 /TAXON_ID=2916 /ORGANISM="Ceratium fusus, Strain PA161109" /LENGTH=150 /DNA_ID=CAMNT_0013491941 /DNA_START=113 /DNA_END=565 /DNA_ORIENTATION=-